MVVEFFEYDFVDSNIVKLYISNVKVSVNVLYVNRSPIFDSDNFANTVKKVVNETKQIVR